MRFPRYRLSDADAGGSVWRLLWPVGNALMRKMKAFWKSAFWGAFAGGFPFLIISAPFGLLMALSRNGEGPFAFIQYLVLALLPILIALPFTATGLLVIGLPVNYLFRRYNVESGWAYTLTGTVVGFVLLALVYGFWDYEFEIFRSALGAIAGGVTAFCWWDFARRAAPPTV